MAAVCRFNCCHLNQSISKTHASSLAANLSWKLSVYLCLTQIAKQTSLYILLLARMLSRPEPQIELPFHVDRFEMMITFIASFFNRQVNLANLHVLEH